MFPNNRKPDRVENSMKTNNWEKNKKKRDPKKNAPFETNDNWKPTGKRNYTETENTTSRFSDDCCSSEVAALLISCEVAPLPEASVPASNKGVVDGGVSVREEVSSGRNTSCTSATSFGWDGDVLVIAGANPTKVRQTDNYE